MASAQHLTVAVTGPTGTFGFGLLPLLEAEPSVERVVGVARREFDPAEHGWTKMTYRRGDVRDPAALDEALSGADVVVHLAFLITGGTASGDTIREINVEGSINVLQAAARAGAARFVYASSVAAYGFHPDNPIGMTEEWPTRPADHLFYAQEKAELEELLRAEAAEHPDLDLYLLRPPVVLGPHAVGGKSALADRLLPFVRRGAALARDVPLPLPVLVPDLPMQVIHEDDVGSGLLRCILGAGPPGAYNIAAPGVLTGADISRELGLHPLSIGSGPMQALARLVAAVPTPSSLPQTLTWAEALSHPTIVDTTKAERDLDWHPRFSALEALRATLEHEPG
jgi:nucleoside-diphosphate-sugar epimerase